MDLLNKRLKQTLAVALYHDEVSIKEYIYRNPLAYAFEFSGALTWYQI